MSRDSESFNLCMARGKNFLIEGDFRAASFSFQLAASFAGDVRKSKAVAHYMMGIALANWDKNGAIMQFDNAIINDSSVPFSYLNKGIVSHNLGQYRAAKEAYDTAILVATGDNENPDNQFALILTYYYKAQLLIKIYCDAAVRDAVIEDERSEAESCFKAAVDIASSFDKSRLNEANTHFIDNVLNPGNKVLIAKMFKLLSTKLNLKYDEMLLEEYKLLINKALGALSLSQGEKEAVIADIEEMVKEDRLPAELRESEPHAASSLPHIEAAHDPVEELGGEEEFTTV